MPERDPWQILGVPPGSDPGTIKQAFRRLALRHHPDRNLDDCDATRRFREISEAYRLLRTRPPDAPPPPLREGLLARIGRRAGLAAGAVGRAFGTGAPAVFPVRVTLAEAFGGCERRFLLELGNAHQPASLRSTVVLPVPPGSRDGDRLAFRWRGGEAVATVEILPHPLLRLRGDDLTADVPIPLSLALTGGRVPVPGIAGPGDLSFDPIEGDLVVYRRRGGGWPRGGGVRGDVLYRLAVEQPCAASADLADPSLYPAHRAYLALIGA